MRRIVLLVSVFCMLLVGRTSAAEGPLSVPDDVKPRVVVMTDIGGDPDDRQSMARFLLYSCDVKVEGLCTGFGHGHRKNTRPDLIRKAVKACDRVLPNLRKHRSDYPSTERLMNLIKDGHNGDPHDVGPGLDSAASKCGAGSGDVRRMSDHGGHIAMRAAGYGLRPTAHAPDGALAERIEHRGNGEASTCRHMR